MQEEAKYQGWMDVEMDVGKESVDDDDDFPENRCMGFFQGEKESKLEMSH